MLTTDQVGNAKNYVARNAHGHIFYLNFRPQLPLRDLAGSRRGSKIISSMLTLESQIWLVGNNHRLHNLAVLLGQTGHLQLLGYHQRKYWAHGIANKSKANFKNCRISRNNYDDLTWTLPLHLRTYRCSSRDPKILSAISTWKCPTQAIHKLKVLWGTARQTKIALNSDCGYVILGVTCYGFRNQARAAGGGIQ